MEALIQEVEGLWDFKEELPEEEPVEFEIKYKAVSAADFESLDANTTHLQIISCSSSEWRKVGESICRLPKVKSLAV